MPLNQTSTAPTVVQLPAMLKRFSIWSVILTVITFADKIFCAYILHLHGVYQQVVFERYYLFFDFLCYLDRFRDFHHTNFFVWDVMHGLVFMYPAPTALAYQFFYILPHPLIAFITTALLGVVIVTAAFWRVLLKHRLSAQAATFLVATMLLCSYPLYVEFFLANIEIVVVFIVAAGIYLFLVGHSRWAAICFGIAGAMKLFPFIFFALLFKRRQYRPIALGLTIAVLLQVFSLWLVSSDILASWHGVNHGLGNFRLNYVLGLQKQDIGIDHSLWGLYKGLLVLSNRPWPHVDIMASQLRIYTLVGAVFSLIIYLRLWRLPILNHVLVLTIIGILLTPASKDYTLLHLYMPLGMLILLAIDASASGHRVPGLETMFVCMTLLLAPLAEFVRNGLIFGAQIKAVVLTLLLTLALRYPLAARNNVTYAPQV